MGREKVPGKKKIKLSTRFKKVILNPHSPDKKVGRMIEQEMKRIPLPEGFELFVDFLAKHRKNRHAMLLERMIDW